MEKIYRDEVYLKFNEERDEWDLLLIENDEIVDSARTIAQLINEHDCLR